MGEVQWLRSNDVIRAMCSDLASRVIEFESGESWHEIIAETNLLILLAQDTPSERVVCRVGDPGEHLLLAIGDAGKSRVGFGHLVHGMRKESTDVNLIKTDSKLPKRVFSSSTGIETLAARLASAESINYRFSLVESGLSYPMNPTGYAGDNNNLILATDSTDGSADFRIPADKNL